MSPPTIVQDYVRAAAQHAEREQLEDGTIAATVPCAFGVIAFGADDRECTANLIAALEDWVHVSQANGVRLPLIDGIDLDSADGEAHAAHHPRRETPVHGRVFEDEDAFLAALEGRAKR